MTPQEKSYDAWAAKRARSSALKSRRKLASIRARRVALRQGKAMMIDLAALYDKAFGGRNREYYAHGAVVSTSSDTGGGSHLFETEPNQTDLMVALLNFAAHLNGILLPGQKLEDGEIIR